MALHALSLCAGIGGLDLALRSLGVVSVGYVERDAYAAAVLVERMADKALDPGPVWSDLATFDARAWRGAVDLVSAGYPCQPFSVAGKKLGADDERHLWPQVARIIREAEPRLVVLENVPGHVKLGLRDVLRDLASLGFDAEWGTFSAASVGAPHRRERLFVLAWHVSDSGRLALGQLAERDLCRQAVRWNPEPGYVGEELADTDGKGRSSSRQSVFHGDGHRQPGNEPDGRGQADSPLGPWPPASDDRDGWARVLAVRPDLAPAQPVLCDLADGAPGEVDGDSWGDQLRCLGNAVVPVQAATAIRALAMRGLT